MLVVVGKLGDVAEWYLDFTPEVDYSQNDVFIHYGIGKLIGTIMVMSNSLEIHLPSVVEAKLKAGLNSRNIDATELQVRFKRELRNTCVAGQDVASLDFSYLPEMIRRMDIFWRERSMSVDRDVGTETSPHPPHNYDATKDTDIETGTIPSVMRFMMELYRCTAMDREGECFRRGDTRYWLVREEMCNLFLATIRLGLSFNYNFENAERDYEAIMVDGPVEGPVGRSHNRNMMRTIFPEFVFLRCEVVRFDVLDLHVESRLDQSLLRLVCAAGKLAWASKIDNICLEKFSILETLEEVLSLSNDSGIHLPAAIESWKDIKGIERPFVLQSHHLVLEMPYYIELFKTTKLEATCQDNPRRPVLPHDPRFSTRKFTTHVSRKERLRLVLREVGEVCAIWNYNRTREMTFDSDEYKRRASVLVGLTKHLVLLGDATFVGDFFSDMSWRTVPDIWRCTPVVI